MENLTEKLNTLIWSEALVIFCVFSGLYFTVRTGFMQFSYIRETLRLLFQKKTTNDGISPFQAFALALSGRVGTGNIVGVATAIGLGGPGAIFWMWAIALFGAASAFIESTLGQIYKENVNGQYRGGPAYYIRKGLNWKLYAILFAILTAIGCTFFLPAIQANSIVAAMNNTFDIPSNTDYAIPINPVALLVIFLLVLIIFGGVKRLGQVSEILIPFIAGAYILIGLFIIVVNYQHIPEVFSLIISSAFGQNSIFGGIVGSAIIIGVKRGIFSNEAGQGIAPHASSAAAVKHPAEQGIVQAFSVYVDTLMVCTITAMMILLTGQYNVLNGQNDTYIIQNIEGVDFTGYTQAAISIYIPSFGNEFVAIALFFFAFTTILAYYYIAETNVSYMVKPKFHKPAIFVLRVLFLIGVYIGSVKEAKLVWLAGDTIVGLMAWANLIAIIALGNIALKVWKDYKTQRKQGVESPVFDAEKLGIKNADYWKKK